MSNILDYNQLSLLERKNLLKGISKTVKKYKSYKINDLREEFTMPYELKESFADILYNNEIIKSDSKIVLENIRTACKNLRATKCIENVDKQRILLESMFSINDLFLLFAGLEVFYNPNFSDESFDKDNKIISLMVDRYGVKPNDSGLVMPDAINDSINDKHNEILKLTDEIHMMK